jgi:hypothetical protein
MDGISSVNSLTSQINGLSKAGSLENYNPKAIEYLLEQNFNQMLEKLVASADSEDDKDEDSFDPFSFMTTDLSKLSIDNAAQESEESALANPLENTGLGDLSYLDSLTQLQDNPLALQSFLNLNVTI